jgi:hypothetical protein
MHSFINTRKAVVFAAFLTGLLVMGSTYGNSIVQYTVAGGSGDNWTGQFVVTNLNGLVTNNGVDELAGTTVSVSANPFGSFNFQQLTGNTPDQTNWVGQYTNPFDSLFTVRSADLYNAINFNFLGVPTWNTLIANGPFALSNSGITRFGLEELGFPNPPETFTNSYTVTGGTITFSAVPEPSAYAMAFAGMALGGYVVGWRKRA